ncbi:MAG: hypothetical protein HQL95_14625 [Magnetococcales bacterium]|nr:hypothetical protein [Magnetococcales bacterium]
MDELKTLEFSRTAFQRLRKGPFEGPAIESPRLCRGIVTLLVYHKHISRGTIMAFIIEKISDEDVVKYNIEALWKKYHPFAEKLPGFYYLWVVDKDRDIYFMRVESGKDIDTSNQIGFELVWGGVTIKAQLRKFSVQCDDENTEIVEWVMERIYHHDDCPYSRDEIISILKEALTSYGRGLPYAKYKNGVLVNYVVLFRF